MDLDVDSMANNPDKGCGRNDRKHGCLLEQMRTTKARAIDDEEAFAGAIRIQQST